MSKRTKAIRDKLYRMIERELKSGTCEDEIIGALEVVKCNLAIAAASATVSLNKPQTKMEQN